MPNERARLVPPQRLHTRASYGSIRDAFERRDADASREAHKQERLKHIIAKNEAEGLQPHSEEHGHNSFYLQCVVFGGMDGIITIFAIAAAALGAGMGYHTVVMFGFANLIANAFSMGFGEYVSTTAERDHAISERDRELWEVENLFDCEVQEMIGVYMSRGLSEGDSTRIVQIMSKSPMVFVDFMMVDELGILLDVSDPYRPLKQGLLTSSSFFIFSLAPLMVYVVGGADMGSQCAFCCCAVVVFISLAVLGAAKGYLTDAGMLRTALAMVANGAVAGGLSFTISSLADSLLPLSQNS